MHIGMGHRRRETVFCARCMHAVSSYRITTTYLMLSSIVFALLLIAR